MQNQQIIKRKIWEKKQKMQVKENNNTVDILSKQPSVNNDNQDQSSWFIRVKKIIKLMMQNPLIPLTAVMAALSKATNAYPLREEDRGEYNKIFEEMRKMYPNSEDQKMINEADENVAFLIDNEFDKGKSYGITRYFDPNIVDVVMKNHNYIDVYELYKHHRQDVIYGNGLSINQQSIKGFHKMNPLFSGISDVETTYHEISHLLRQPQINFALVNDIVKKAIDHATIMEDYDHANKCIDFVKECGKTLIDLVENDVNFASFRKKNNFNMDVFACDRSVARIKGMIQRNEYGEMFLNDVLEIDNYAHCMLAEVKGDGGKIKNEKKIIKEKFRKAVQISCLGKLLTPEQQKQAVKDSNYEMIRLKNGVNDIRHKEEFYKGNVNYGINANQNQGTDYRAKQDVKQNNVSIGFGMS